MNVDLGPYAVEVLSAYAGALALLLAIITASVVRARSVARRLSETEARRRAQTR